MLDATPVPIPPPAAAIRYPALTPHRLAVRFEALRDASDKVLAATGARPKVFLANLGTVAEFTARATFAKNFFEAGGIEAITSDGFKSRDEIDRSVQGVGREARVPVLVATPCTKRKPPIPPSALAAAAQRISTVAGRPKDARRPTRRPASARSSSLVATRRQRLKAAHEFSASQREAIHIALRQACRF